MVWFCGAKVVGGGVGVDWWCFCLCLLAWRESGPVGMWACVGESVWGFWCPVGYWVTGVVGCVRVWVCARGWCRLVVGSVLLGVSGVRDCLGAGCVVAGGGLPVWLGVAVASGGVGVSFDVGLRVFVLSGVSVPVSGSGSVVPVSPGAVVAASEFGSESASVGSVSSLASLSGSAPVSGVSGGPAPVPEFGSVAECGGVRVCVPCARAVFGDGWCFLVLRRWARAAGVDGARVSGLLSSSVDCVPGFGSLSDGSVPVSGSVPVESALVSGGCVSSRVSSRVGRVGVGFGARVRDWGARVGVGGGVVPGGGVVAGWWEGVVGCVRALASGVGSKGLVLLGLVGVVLLVSVLVLVG